MSWYDYVPGVSNVAGAIKGNWGEAATGPLNALTGGAPNRIISGLGPTKPDLSASQGANQRAQAATQGFAAERQAYQPMQAPQIGAPPPGAAPGAYAAVGPATTARTGANHFGGGSGYAGGPGSGGPGSGGPGSGGPFDNNARQQGALDMLQGAAMGTTPSAAEIQSGQQLGTAMANQFALASGLQGRHPGAAFDAAARGAANVQGQVIGQGAAQRAAEQAQARDAYATAVGGARGQDIQTDVANLNAKLTTMGYDQQTRHDLLSAQLTAQGYDKDTADAIINAQAAAAQSANQYKAGLISTGGQLFGALG